MSLKLMYITNNPQIASAAEDAGVDRIFVDTEYIGKEQRQAGMDSVKPYHTLSDVLNVRRSINKSELLVRINPIHKAVSGICGSSEEIDRVIDAGADVIMLPMYRTLKEVEEFLRAVNGRAKTQLLCETPEACGIMESVASLPEVDEIHIGLNDLHIAYRKRFLFELLADGTVDEICSKIKRFNKPFGIGGIARIGYGLVPAEYIIREHYRIGSTCAILSRTFCNADKIKDIDKIRSLFETETVNIRRVEGEAAKMSKEEFEENRKKVQSMVSRIAEDM